MGGAQEGVKVAVSWNGWARGSVSPGVGLSVEIGGLLVDREAVRI